MEFTNAEGMVPDYTEMFHHAAIGAKGVPSSPLFKDGISMAFPYLGGKTTSIRVFSVFIFKKLSIHILMLVAVTSSLCMVSFSDVGSKALNE